MRSHRTARVRAPAIRGLRRILASLAALSAPACGEASPGALGQAGVSSDCPHSDVACVVQGLDGPVAVGGAVKLHVAVQFQGAATPVTTLLSSHPAVLAAEGGTVRGMSPGLATLLILLGGSETVVDFLHVWVAAPDRLALHILSDD